MNFFRMFFQFFYSLCIVDTCQNYNIATLIIILCSMQIEFCNIPRYWFLINKLMLQFYQHNVLSFRKPSYASIGKATTCLLIHLFSHNLYYRYSGNQCIQLAIFLCWSVDGQIREKSVFCMSFFNCTFTCNEYTHYGIQRAIGTRIKMYSDSVRKYYIRYVSNPLVWKQTYSFSYFLWHSITKAFVTTVIFGRCFWIQIP